MVIDTIHQESNGITHELMKIFNFSVLLPYDHILGSNFLLEMNSQTTVIRINPTAKDFTYPTSCTILMLKMGISRQVFV